MNKTQERNELHESRLKQVDDFIANGGSISIIESGKCLEFATAITERQRSRLKNSGKN